MFAPFTEPARKLALLAQDEASTQWGMPRPPSREHFLLGAFKQDRGLAAEFIGSLADDADRLAHIVAVISQQNFQTNTWGAPETMKMVDDAVKLSSSLGQRHVTTGHILYVLLSDPESQIGQAVDRAGIDPTEPLKKLHQRHAERKWNDDTEIG